MKAKVALYEGGFARLNGPLKIRVDEGQVMVLGAIYKRGDSFSVSEHRSYALKALVDSRVSIEFLKGGSVEMPRPGEEPLDQWVATVDAILRRGCRRIMVLGQVDAGKSSIAALVANRALLYGHRPGIVDSDVGQADIGPPATVSAAPVEKPILWLRELRAAKIRFIGYITPQRAERRIAAAIVDLTEWLVGNGSDVVVVDTDGWIQGVQSLEYKLEAAHLAGVDALITVGDRKLHHMVSSAWRSRGCGVHHLESPAVRKTRDRAERRSLRSEAYRRFLEPSRPRQLELDKVSVLGSCFFLGEPLPTETARAFAPILRVPVLAASETYDTVYVVTVGQADPAGVEKLSEALNKQVYILDVNNMRGALVALLGPEGEEKAIGLLREIDFNKRRATVATPYTGRITGIIVGGTRLGPDYEEQGRPLRCVL